MSLKIINISETPDFSSILCDFPGLFQSVQNSLTEKCLPIFSRFSSSSGYPAIPLRQIWWLYPSRYVGSVGTDFLNFLLTEKFHPFNQWLILNLNWRDLSWSLVNYNQLPYCLVRLCEVTVEHEESREGSDPSCSFSQHAQTANQSN